VATLQLTDGITTLDIAGTGAGSGYYLVESSLRGMGSEHVGYTMLQTPDRSGATPSRMEVKNRTITASLNIVGASHSEVEAQKVALQSMLDKAANYWIAERSGQPVTIRYNMGATTQTSTCKVLGGMVEAAGLNNMDVTNMMMMAIKITIITEPYWQGALQLANNLLFNPNSERGLVGWTVTLGTMSTTYGGTFGTRFQVGDGSSAPCSANSSDIPVSAGDVIMLDGILEFPVGVGCSINLSVFNGSWNPAFSSLVGVTSGAHIVATWTVPAGYTFVRFLINKQSIAGLVYAHSLRIAKNIGTALPAVMTGCTIVQMGDAALDAASRTASSSFPVAVPLNVGDSPAVTAWRYKPTTNAAGTARVGHVIWGKSGKRADWLLNYSVLDQSIGGYSPGGNTGTNTGVGANWMGGTQVAWTPTTVLANEEIARWNLGVLFGTLGNLPNGRVSVYAAASWYGPTLPMFPKLGLAVQIGATSYTVDAYYPVTNEAAASQPPRLMYIGSINLDGMSLPDGYSPGARSLVLCGQLGATGVFSYPQNLLLDYLVMIPEAEAMTESIGAEAQTPTETVTYNAGYSSPEITIETSDSSPTVANASWQNWGGAVTFAPGETTYVAVAWSRYPDNGSLENGKAMLAEIRYQPLYLLPRGSQ